MRSINKKGFVDPSIGAAALGLSAERLLDEPTTSGFFFEGAWIRDLTIYSTALGSTISYYRDRYGLECDIVLHLDDGSFALIESKLGSKEIEDGCSNLLKINNLLRRNKLRKPTFMAVITGGRYAYKRPDGRYVILLGCLKP